MIFKKILLIGGTGFIGSALAKVLSQQDGLSVTVVHVDDLKSEEIIAGINYIKIDLSSPDQRVSEIIDSNDCAIFMTQPNYQLLTNFLKKARFSSIKKIVYTSTVLLYNQLDWPQDEIEELNPETDYEKNKYKEEQLLKEFASDKNKVCIARLANVYGDVKNRGIVNIIIKALVTGSTLTVNGDGQQKRDYIFIEDVVDGLKSLIFYSQEKAFDVFNVCTGISYSILELVEHLEIITEKKSIIKYADPVKEKRNIVGNNGKIKKQLGFNPKYDLLSGLKQAYKNYQKNE